MAKFEGDTLAVLQTELKFLESGGYQWCLQKPWRPPLAFIESKTCPRHSAGVTSCEQCALMQFVPVESAEEKTPCWHIPLNEAGQNLDSLYRWGSEEEINQSLKTWLWSTILEIEDEQRAAMIALRHGKIQSKPG